MADKYISVAGSTQIVADDGSGRFYPKVQLVIVNGDGSNTPLTATNGVLNTAGRALQLGTDQVATGVNTVTVWTKSYSGIGSTGGFVTEAAITTTTVAGITVPMLSRLFLGVVVTAVSGTTPTLDVALDAQDANGYWYQLANPTSGTKLSTAIVGGFTPAATTAQAGAAIGPGEGSATLIGLALRFRYNIAGTTPSFTFAVSILGN